jgi:hypothetical protein
MKVKKGLVDKTYEEVGKSIKVKNLPKQVRIKKKVENLNL